MLTSPSARRADFGNNFAIASDYDSIAALDGSDHFIEFVSSFARRHFDIARHVHLSVPFCIYAERSVDKVDAGNLMSRAMVTIAI